MGCERMVARRVETELPEAFPQSALPPKIKIIFGSERLRKCKRMNKLFLFNTIGIVFKDYFNFGLAF